MKGCAMNKLILTFAGAMALSFTANAVALFSDNETWFDGGIEEGWPEKAKNGGWSNTNGTTYADSKLTVSALAETPLTFTADVAKVTSDYKATISSTVGFTAFEELPTVPTDAKAGVIAFTNGTFWALAKGNADYNVWKDTLIATNAEVKIDVTFIDANTVEYKIGDNTPVTNTVKTVESVRNVCMSGDGTLAGLSATAEAKAKPVEPVVPGEPIEVPTGSDPQQFVAQVEENKATLLTAPEGALLTGESLTAYQSLFKATLDGMTVKFVLNEEGTNTVVEATTDAKTNVLAVVLSEGSTFTVDKPIKGFYYSFKQGSEVTNLTFRVEETDKNQLATESKNPSFELEKPEGKGFYNTLVTPTKVQ